MAGAGSLIQVIDTGTEESSSGEYTRARLPAWFEGFVGSLDNPQVEEALDRR